MEYKLTKIGEQMSNRTGVRAIMKDIHETLRSGSGRSFINLSPGNPVILPEVVELWKRHAKDLIDSPEFGEVVGRYGMTQGYQPFIEAIVKDFNSRYNLALTEKNVLITSGSQSLYFFAANMLGGLRSNGKLAKILLPLCPDYTGYGGISVYPEALVSFKPILDINEGSHSFKYRPDFNNFKIPNDTGAVIFSRPCNPTGNVLTDSEVEKIVDLAAQVNVPVFVDSAYAPPYPALNFTEMSPILRPNVIHCLSLSKAGLPGERIGVALGDPELLERLESFESNASIHSSRFGQAIAARAINSGELGDISEKIIRPFYHSKFSVFEDALRSATPPTIPFYLHRGEGALFAWIWFRDLPIDDWSLYQKLKSNNVMVVPGSTFFPGLNEDWKHKSECIRVSLTASEQELIEGAKRIARTISEIY